MTEDLDRFTGAYDPSFPYELDNRLILHWALPSNTGCEKPTQCLIEAGCRALAGMVGCQDDAIPLSLQNIGCQ